MISNRLDKKPIMPRNLDLVTETGTCYRVELYFDEERKVKSYSVERHSGERRYSLPFCLYVSPKLLDELAIEFNNLKNSPGGLDDSVLAELTTRMKPKTLGFFTGLVEALDQGIALKTGNFRFAYVDYKTGLDIKRSSRVVKVKDLETGYEEPANDDSQEFARV